MFVNSVFVVMGIKGMGSLVVCLFFGFGELIDKLNKGDIVVFRCGDNVV